jgi:hypothetical protein
MTQQEQRKHNRAVIKRVQLIQGCRRWFPPSYKAVVIVLNAEGYTTTRGNPWTPKRLFRMLQRKRVRGLWGLHQQRLLQEKKERTVTK